MTAHCHTLPASLAANAGGIYACWRHGRMSLLGYKETLSRPKSTSALPPKADEAEGRHRSP